MASVRREPPREAEYVSLFICTTCLELFDRPLSGRGGLEQQKCRCQHRPDEPRWAGYDFNERARLCDCCGRRVLRSGSRWSVWFCSACKDRIVSLNQEFGFAVIPIGRHSLMSGFGLQGGSGDAEVHGFFEQLQDMCRQIDILQDDWKPAHLREELERLELVARGEVPPRGIPLSTYLQAVADEDRTSGIDHRLRAFRALRETFTRS